MLKLENHCHREIGIYVHQDTRTSMFLIALLIIAKDGNKTNVQHHNGYIYYEIVIQCNELIKVNESQLYKIA